jgi:hypothetical protein
VNDEWNEVCEIRATNNFEGFKDATNQLRCQHFSQVICDFFSRFRSIWNILVAFHWEEHFLYEWYSPNLFYNFHQVH